MTVMALGGSFGFMPQAEAKGAEQREWVNKLLAFYRLNQTQLATKAGVDPSTLSKFMAASRPGHQLSTAIVGRIENAFRLRYPDDPEGAPPIGLAEPDAVSFDFKRGDADAAGRAAKAMCEGHNGRDPWEIQSEVLREVGVLPGDIVVVDLNETPHDGDIVCAQSYGSGGRAETVFRIFRQPFFLVGAGPGARVPLVADNRAAQIRGVVVGTFRRRGVSAAVA